MDARLATKHGALEPPGRAVSWTEIERLVLSRIAKGVYSAGMQLPTCERFAAEYGANKNTVNKAYRSLVRRGYLTMRAGAGTFVARKPVKIDLDRATDEIR